MVIEQKYGFNRSTVKTFIFDCIRSVLLEFVLSLALVGLMMLLHKTVGDWIILLFAGAVFAITLIISFLYPVFSRIGNKFTPLEDGELKDKLMALLALMSAPFLFLSGGKCSLHRRLGINLGCCMALCVYEHDAYSTAAQPLLSTMKTIRDTLDFEMG